MTDEQKAPREPEAAGSEFSARLGGLNGHQNCPACNAHWFFQTVWLAYHGQNLLVCDKCGHRFAHEKAFNVFDHITMA